jgi:hypothetical protein
MIVANGNVWGGRVDFVARGQQRKNSLERNTRSCTTCQAELDDVAMKAGQGPWCGTPTVEKTPHTVQVPGRLATLCVQAAQLKTTCQYNPEIPHITALTTDMRV